MQQLSGLDASFLNLESPTTYGHVSSLTIYQPPEGWNGFEATKQAIATRLGLLAPFRRRLVQVPFGLDLPYWISDPHFDLDYHVRHHAIPAPGDDHQLAEAVARIVARPLDRSRPLWELYVIEGLEGGLVAELTKVHHCTIDGASGAELLTILLDPTPDAQPRPATDGEFTPESVPTDAELMRRTFGEYLRRPEKFVRLNVRVLRELAHSTRSGGIAAMADLAAQPLPGPVGDWLRHRLRASRGVEVDHPPALPPTPAPKTPWNRAITPHRRFAFCTVPLADAKRIKNAFGTTFNDVVMALCSTALRRYLISHDALPAEPLIAMVPVSLRTGAEHEAYQNRVSGVLCNLATDVDDPVERLLAIRASMNAAKDMHAAMPAELLQDFTLFAPPAVAARAMRLVLRTQVGDRFNPPFNLIISNVPGPSTPLYLAGATLRHFYPVSTIIDGQGLNMTVQSYNGSLDFGFIADRELIPDLWDLCGHLNEGVEELLKAATPA